MTQFVTQGAPVGAVATVPNALASSELDTAILTDPVKIASYRDSIASQLNNQSGGPQFKDLSERIAGIRIETSAQGASILVLDLIDPAWVIPMSGFITVDQNGMLWPPIDVNFPTGTDQTWRLAQYRAVWSQELDQPNLTLTFEDRIVSLLREMSPSATGGVSQGLPNQTLGGFIKQLVDSANQSLKPHPKLRLVELISPADPNYVTPITSLPASAQSPLRQQNPFKAAKPMSASQIKALQAIDSQLAQVLGDAQSLATGGRTIQEIEARAAQQLTPNAPGRDPVNPVAPGLLR